MPRLIPDNRRTPFGARLRTSRKNAGMSQIEVGDELGLTQGAVSRWEVGDNEPDLQTLKTLCTMYGVSADSLLEDL